MKRSPRPRLQQLHVRLPDPLLKAIKDLAQRENNNETAVVRRLLSLGLETAQAQERAVRA